MLNGTTISEKYTISQTPECQSEVKYQIIGQEDWLEHREAESDFMIKKDVEVATGIYPVKLEASVTFYTDYTKTEEKTISSSIDFNIEVMNLCEDDEVEAIGVIPDQIYSIALDGMRVFSPQWSSTIPSCPKTHSFVRI
jgi:hypothetical protein